MKLGLMTIQLDFAYQYSARGRLQFVGDSLVMDIIMVIASLYVVWL
jgi:hypothetical protein